MTGPPPLVRRSSGALAASVLLINKFFYPSAGAETAFFHQRDLLQRRRHKVVDFATADARNLESLYSEYFAPQCDFVGAAGLAKARTALATVYSRPARIALQQLLTATGKPDIAHLHNFYHQLTFSVVDELYSRQIPMVMTLHDYKLACPSYDLYTKGQPCRRCLDGSTFNAVRHRCLKSSAAASAVVALEASIARRRKSFLRIDRFLAPSRFVRDVAIEAGIPEDRVTYLANMMPDSEIPKGADACHRAPVFIFGGRLEETKGVRELLEGFARVDSDCELHIAGWGALEGPVRDAAAQDPRITFLGRLERPELHQRLAQARALIVPSTWEDNCPYMILEAQALRTPAIVSSLGGPKEFVRDERDGLVVDPRDPAAIAAALVRLASDRRLASTFGESGYHRLLQEHSEDLHYQSLTRVYEEVMA